MLILLSQTNMKKNIKLFSLLLIICLSACEYQNEEELFAAEDPQAPDNTCNTDNVSYSQQVLPVLEGFCLGCHSEAARSGGVVLEGYDNVKRFVDNGRLLGSISHDVGFSPMPRNGRKLADCTIEQISSWIDAGADNN